MPARLPREALQFAVFVYDGVSVEEFSAAGGVGAYRAQLRLDRADRRRAPVCHGTSNLIGDNTPGAVEGWRGDGPVDIHHFIRELQATGQCIYCGLRDE